MQKKQADKRAQVEYKKYRQNTLSQVERDYLNVLNKKQKRIIKINRIGELLKNKKSRMREDEKEEWYFSVVDIVGYFLKVKTRECIGES